MSKSLNPCSNGRYSQSVVLIIAIIGSVQVLILVLMEDTLRGLIITFYKRYDRVLILVLMEDTLREQDTQILYIKVFSIRKT